MTSPHNPVSSGNDGERVSAPLSKDARLILWTLDSPLTEAISVKQPGKFDPDNPVTEPYYLGPGSWHPLSQSPLTTPKISSVTIRVDPLDDWEYTWLENHRDHADPGCNNDQVRFGSLPDPDEYEREREVHLLMCCGTERPRNKGTKLLVQATGDFLTVHDFLSTVHPYLMARRDDIMAALEEKWFGIRQLPRSADPNKLLVTWGTPDSLTVMKESEWLRIYGKRIKLSELESTGMSPAAAESLRAAIAVTRASRQQRQLAAASSQ